MKIRTALTAGVILLSCLTGCEAVDEIAPNEEVQSTVYINPQNAQNTEDYVLSTLDKSERAAYDAILEAVKGFEPTVQLAGDFDSSRTEKIFTLVYTQESRVFWLDSKFYYPDENNVLSLFYRYTSDEVSAMRAELEFAIGTVIGSLPENSGDYETVSFFHDTIIKGCTFSMDGKFGNTAYGAIVDGFAQCEGYAFAMSYLCDSVGIDNYVVNGTNSSGESHAWNKIYADGSWYNVDCTWDDPILNYDNPNYLRHDYMFVPDSEINGITHFVSEEYFSPLPCVDTANNYFIKENLYFTSADDGIASLFEQIKKLAAAEEREAEIRFDGMEAYEITQSRLFDNGELKETIENLNGRYGFKIKSAHKNVNDEMHIIHISLIYDDDV